VAERNVAAKAFWPRAIGAAPNVSELVQLEGDGTHWRGPIWSFQAADRSLQSGSNARVSLDLKATGLTAMALK
jgi:hypothetical protein